MVDSGGLISKTVVNLYLWSTSKLQTKESVSEELVVRQVLVKIREDFILIMTTPKAKPYKLKPSDGIMTRDDIALWEYTLLASCRQIQDWQKFLPQGENEHWTATDEDTNNGFYHDNAATQTKLRNDFANFITCVATHCPTGFLDTVIRESTSFKDIVKQIKTTYNLDSKGEKFLSLMDIKLEFSPSFTYEQGYMMIKDFCMESLLPTGSHFKGRILDEPEKLSPLAESFIMKEFLHKVHPKLPEHIRNTKGHLFTRDRPTLACNKALLLDLMDSMLSEIENLDTIATASIRVNQVTQNRMQSSRGRGYRSIQGSYNRGGIPRYNQRFNRTPQTLSRFSAPRRQDCSFCVEARRYDSSKGHTANNCPFRLGTATPYQATSRQHSYGPGMRVFLVQDPSFPGQQADTYVPEEQWQQLEDGTTAPPDQTWGNAPFYSDYYENEQEHTENPYEQL